MLSDVSREKTHMRNESQMHLIGVKNNVIHENVYKVVLNIDCIDRQRDWRENNHTNIDEWRKCLSITKIYNSVIIIIISQMY